MKLFSLFRIAFFTGIFLIMNNDAAADPLDSYRWKNRLIIASVPTKEERDHLAASLVSDSTKLVNRNLLVIDVTLGRELIPGTVHPNQEQTNMLRHRFKLNSAKKTSQYILIGKDGGEKARRQGALNLANWLDLIDEMPMRRDEIKNQALDKQQ